MKAILFLLSISMLFVSCSNSEHESSSTNTVESVTVQPDEGNAYSIAQKFIRNRIDQPSFPYKPVGVYREGEYFVFESYFDYDGDHREAYFMEVKHNGGDVHDTSNWHVRYLAIGEDDYIKRNP